MGQTHMPCAHHCEVSVARSIWGGARRCVLGAGHKVPSKRYLVCSLPHDILQFAALCRILPHLAANSELVVVQYMHSSPQIDYRVLPRFLGHRLQQDVWA